jgi:hypothetical protein
LFAAVLSRSPCGVGRVELTREGLLQADGLLPSFFEPEYRGVRYT